MKLIDFEKQILLKYQMEDEFKEFLKNDNLLKLEKTTEIFSGAKDEGDDSCFVEAIVGDYLEEISGLKQFSEEENKKNIRIKNSEERVEKLVVGNTLMVVNIAFDYLVRGISFLDLIQEGNIGLLRALDNCSDKKSISLCMEMWIRREMLLLLKMRWTMRNRCINTTY